MTESVLDDPKLSTEALLAQLSELRRTTRARRHAFWLPLLIFGLLICAAAPMYDRSVVSSIVAQGSFPDGFATGGGGLTWLNAFSGGDQQGATQAMAGYYWLIALILGAAITAVWYAWHARATGVHTKVARSLVAWLGGTLLFVAASTVSVTAVLRYELPVTAGGNGALLVVALGLLVLAWVERSWLLTGIAVAFTGAAVLGLDTLWSPENLIYDVWSWFGVSDQHMPFNTAGMIDVLLPGAVLLLGAAIAVVVDLRKQ
jgi:hypothetical protein